MLHKKINIIRHYGYVPNASATPTKIDVRVTNKNFIQQHTKSLQTIYTLATKNLIYFASCFRYSHYATINTHKLKNLYSPIGLKHNHSL